jgi:NAD(P)-dependent dehydrogenase (short-subunit alcohol dehydrogenase family)
MRGVAKADILQLDVTNVEVVMTTVQWPSRSVFWSITRARIGSNTVEKVSVADCDFVMNLNVRAAYFMAQAVAKRLIEASLAGSIINMSSQMGHVGSADRSLYCASKWAMEGFSKSMAIDPAPHRIRANC